MFLNFKSSRMCAQVLYAFFLRMRIFQTQFSMKNSVQFDLDKCSIEKNNLTESDLFFDIILYIFYHIINFRLYFL